MRKSGPIMYVLDDDDFIDQYFYPPGARYQPPGDRFEIDHLDVALKHVKRFRTAIDGGAYYGSWARYMAQQFGSVWAFEPTDSLFTCLHRNTCELGNVASLNLALGAQLGVVVMGQGRMYHHPGMETVLPTPWADIRFDRGVRMVTVDNMDLSDLDFLKLDIEGYEYFALQGARETLIRCRPVVMFEENVRGKLEHDVKPGTCGEFLTELGAELVDRVGSDYVYAWKD